MSRKLDEEMQKIDAERALSVNVNMPQITPKKFFKNPLTNHKKEYILYI